jgi:hypothetical protein
MHPDQGHVSTFQRLNGVLRALFSGLLWMIGAIVSALLLLTIGWFWVSIFLLSARPAESAEPLVGLLTLLVVCVTLVGYYASSRGFS